MTIHKTKSGVFKARFSVNGVRIQESTGFKTKKEAALYEKKREHELRQEILLGVKPKRTWEEACSRWLKEMNHKRTINQDKAKLKILQKDLGGKQLTAIDKKCIEFIVQKNENKVKPATINRTLALIRSILNKCLKEWEWVDKIPNIKLKSELNSRIRYLSKKEADRLLQELPNHLRLMAQFALATGLRQKNISQLKWAQVNNNLLIIPSSQFKSGKYHSIPLNSMAIQILNECMGIHSEFVFTYKGTPVTQVNTKAWRKALKRAQIDDFRFHDLRHTWASWHVQNGTSLQELQALGGWSSFQMVLKYAHLNPSNLQEASERVTACLT